MKKPIGRPSPSMVVACIALVMATTGSAIAAVSFARNAGAVDGLSAVSAGASTNQAAGKLVATARLGAARGHISSKFLPPFVAGHGVIQGFAEYREVIDQAAAAPFALVAVPGFGSLASTCADQDGKPGVEDPSSTITFTNTSGEAVNWSRQVGNGAAQIKPILNLTVESFPINGSNSFTLLLQKRGVTLTLRGAVRQDGAGTNNAFCLIFGQALQAGT